MMHERINIIMNYPIDNLTMNETIALVEDYIKQRKLCQHVAVNDAKLVDMPKDPQLRQIISACDIIAAKRRSETCGPEKFS